MSDDRVAVTLPRLANAPMLNRAVADAEATLTKLREKLGAGSSLGDIASTGVTLTNLTRMIPPPATTSKTTREYGELHNQLEQLARLLEKLDIAAVNALTKSGDSANKVRTEFLEMTDKIHNILNQVTDNPGPMAEMNAILAIKNVVADATEKVAVEHVRQAGHARDFVARTPRYVTQRSPQPISPEQIAQMAEMYDYLTVKYGLEDSHAAAAIANLLAESGGNPTAFNPAEGAFGLFQWRDARLKNLRDYAAGQGKSANNPYVQLDFMMRELQTTESKARERLITTRTPGDAAAAFDKYYERSSGSTRIQRMTNAASIAAALGDPTRRRTTEMNA